MYLKDLLKKITMKKNIPIWIYLILNIFIISGIVALFTSEIMPYWETLLLSVVLYIFSISLALSPLGEFILRLQTGCKKIKRMEQINFINPIFSEVYRKAKQKDPQIPNDIQLYINDDKAPNAFATGRKTICITEGMLYMPENQIKAALAHEFGHLAHRDTDLILLVSVGNLIISTFILGIRLVIDLFHIFFAIIGLALGGEEGLFTVALNIIYHALFSALIIGLTWIWTKIGILLVMKSSRENEYEADTFSFNLGYGNDLCELLDKISVDKHQKGLFANLANSHPDRNDRIGRLQNQGATYRATYGG